MSESTDFLIVGGGLAGQVLQIQLAERGLDTLLLDEPQNNHSSMVAAGIINPIIGKFFTLSWQANEVFEEMHQFYPKVESSLNATFFRPKPIKRIFATAGEQNIWLSKAHQAKYAKYCNFSHEEMNGFKADYGILHIDKGGELDIKAFLNTAKNNYPNRLERFEFEKLDLKSKRYADIGFKHIVICQGYQMRENPLFNASLIIPNKGELIEIICPELNEEAICLGPVFIQPFGENRYRVGSTYTPNVSNTLPSPAQKMDLVEKLQKVLKLNFEVINHYAGVRPTTVDRKPILGTHKEYSFVHIFNGLGSKGASLAPFVAKHMVHHLLDGIPLPSEMDLARF
ncbi:MAG: hypothetical protein RLZZ337_1001 [Bacteroidota bacterium]|jgi:glycine/D-amino acid oxidase-like deaminating enzyme